MHALYARPGVSCFFHTLDMDTIKGHLQLNNAQLPTVCRAPSHPRELKQQTEQSPILETTRCTHQQALPGRSWPL